MNMYQNEALLGSNIPSYIEHPTLLDLHPVPDEDAYFSDEEEQTYDDFVDMGKRKPNSMGTDEN